MPSSSTQRNRCYNNRGTVGRYVGGKGSRCVCVLVTYMGEDNEDKLKVVLGTISFQTCITCKREFYMNNDARFL